MSVDLSAPNLLSPGDVADRALGGMWEIMARIAGARLLLLSVHLTTAEADRLARALHLLQIAEDIGRSAVSAFDTTGDATREDLAQAAEELQRCDSVLDGADSVLQGLKAYDAEEPLQWANRLMHDAMKRSRALASAALRGVAIDPRSA